MKKITPKLLTIGVYGFDEEDFYSVLLHKGVDGFCDIRQRRGLRGSRYAFANSRRLQEKLKDLGIHYVHIKALAPTEEIRRLQKTADQSSQTKKRQRGGLSNDFIEAYKAAILDHYDPETFLDEIGQGREAVVLFCVEREPKACHRSLAADFLAQMLDLEVEHIRP